MSKRTEFLNGTEAAARAAQEVNYHILGYFPTQSPQFNMIAGESDQATAAINYGASLGGGRVFNITTMSGMLETLQLQAHSRQAMVLNLISREDHANLYAAFHSGWIILLARDPQAVYDLNLAAVKIGEHADIRLPVIICYDGYFTSEQKHRLEILDDHPLIQSFLGEPPHTFTALDPLNPVTFGIETINIHKQHALAMDAARKVIPEVLSTITRLTGHAYPILDAYCMSDAEYAVVLLNTAAETAKDVVDQLREQGQKVGVLSPNLIRPFPTDAFRDALKNIKVCVIGDRADVYGADGGNLSLEIRAALQQDPENNTVVLSRIYGKKFQERDAKAFFKLAQNSQDALAFDYHGTRKKGHHASKGMPLIETKAVSRHMATVSQNPNTGKLRVELEPLWAMADVTSRIAPGHGACPGCGIFSMLHQMYSILEGNLVVLFQSGCGVMVTTDYPKTSHRITYIHNQHPNGAATLSGLVEMYYEKVKRGELPELSDFTFLMITGDGGMDMGMGSAIGAAHRNHRMIILEYDNQGKMESRGQDSYSTPMSQYTPYVKDTAQIFAACHLPYVFTASEGFSEDLMRKVAKAQWYAKREGLVYGKIMSFCPLYWQTPDSVAQSVMQAALDCTFFPLYEVENGKTTLTYDPDVLGTRLPIASWLKRMGKTKPLLKTQNADILTSFETEVDRRWKRLKAMHEHEEL